MEDRVTALTIIPSDRLEEFLFSINVSLSSALLEVLVLWREWGLELGRILSPEDPTTSKLPAGHMMIFKVPKKGVLATLTDPDYHEET